MDSISGTYRSIATTGQNPQIRYLPVQLKPVEEIEEKVNRRAHHWPWQRENMKMGVRGGVEYPLEKMYNREDNHNIKTCYQAIA